MAFQQYQDIEFVVEEGEEHPKKQRKVDKSYVTWNTEERSNLLKKRIELDHLFTNKNANSNEGWRMVACSGNIGVGKNYKNCKTQWASLLKKYKTFCEISTGEGVGDDASEKKEAKENWPYYNILHEYALKKHNYHPPYLLSNSEGALQSNSNRIESDIMDEESFSLSSSFPGSTPPTPPTSSFKINNFSAFEKHVIKRDKKITKNISALMAVFGQVVKEEHPNIDVNALIIGSDSDSD